MAKLLKFSHKPISLASEWGGLEVDLLAGEKVIAIFSATHSLFFGQKPYSIAYKVWRTALCNCGNFMTGAIIKQQGQRACSPEERWGNVNARQNALHAEYKFSVRSLVTTLISLLLNPFIVFLCSSFFFVHQIQILYQLYNTRGML